MSLGEAWGGVSNCSRHKLHIVAELLPRPAVVKTTMRIFFKTQNTFRCEVKAIKTQGLKQTVLDLNMSNLGASNREPRKWRSVVMSKEARHITIQYGY